MKRWVRLFIALVLGATLLAPPANALVNERESTVWGHIFAGQTNIKTVNAVSTSGAKLEAKSKFEVTYNNFPAWAQRDIQAAIDVWAANFQSSVPITVEATWARSNVYGLLGSARPGNYFNNFVNAPDATLSTLLRLSAALFINSTAILYKLSTIAVVLNSFGL